MVPSSLSPALNHLWQSTLIATVAATLAVLLKSNRAQARYWVWLAASMKFLIPFSLLVGVGSRFGSPTASPNAPGRFSMVVEQFGQPFAQAQPHIVAAPNIAASQTGWLPDFLIAVWFVGFAAVLMRWCLNWQRVRAKRRTGSFLPLQLSVPVVSTPGLLEPGVFGIWRPVILLPEGITEHLAPSQMKAILAHELCHVRRRDNLAAAIHLIVEAIFWFHPMVWWIGARLVEERERACDEEVLSMGNGPNVYAESILKVSKFYLGSRLTCMSGVTGSDLKARIERIMTNCASRGLNLTKKLLLAGAGVAVVAGPILFGLLSVPRSIAQPKGASPKRLSFDIISIRPAAPFRATTPFGNDFKLWYGPDSHVILSNVTLQFLIKLAYGLRDDQIASSGPSWFGLRRFDIDAKCDPPVGGDPRRLSFDERQAYNERLNLRIQSLLADRFGLKLRQEAKEKAVFDLVVAKNGHKFQASPPPGPDGQVKQGSRVWPGHMEVYRANIEVVARMLSDFAGRTVIDRTGLTGSYDLTLDWSPEAATPLDAADPNAKSSAADASGPSLFTAVQEQLGLKLESAKGPVPLFVVESASLPDAN
ncbi:MAG TPA: M56 family metallopeptidase [Bryobacteraceae bacterium]|nr:M56 family metallopeptidase [Bryobacteraceae bacterium]